MIRQQKLQSQLAGVSSELKANEDTGQTLAGVPCCRGNRPYWVHSSRVTPLRWCWWVSPCSCLLSHRHPWISASLHSLCSIPTLQKGSWCPERLNDLHGVRTGGAADWIQVSWNHASTSTTSHCSFVASFPLTLAAFAAGWLCTEDPKLTEVGGSPLTDFQWALDPATLGAFFPIH